MSLAARIGVAMEAMQPALIELRRDLHRHPELSLQEHRTTALLRARLAAAGLQVHDLGLATGAVATVRGAREGPTLALRADIDALPILEATGLPFASETPGCMHACGHDLHTTVMLGTALALQGVRGGLRGSVRFLFQPAEEIARGARQLIDAGALQGVDAVLGFHNKPDVPVGSVGVRSGPLMAAADMFALEIRGLGGHAAMPDRAIDPIVAGAAVVLALQTAVSRNISPLESVVVSVGQFHAGTAQNIIPDAARIEGTVRCFSPAVREQMPGILRRIATEVAAGFGAEARLEYTAGTPALRNDATLCDLMRRAAAAVVGEERVVEAQPVMASEDFAMYQELVPGHFAWLGVGNPAIGAVENWHHPRFIVDEAAIPLGIRVFAQAALDFLAAAR